jgi:hypothetical protein
MILYNNLFFNNFFFILKNLWNFNFDNLNIFNTFNFYLLPQIDKIVLTIVVGTNLKSVTDMKIVYNLSILDFLINKKSNIDKLLHKYLKKNKTIIFVTTSSVNSIYDVYLLLFILQKIIILNLSRKFIYFTYKINNNNFFIKIDDLSSLDELPAILKREKVSLKLSFFLNINKKSVSKYIFKSLGF